MWDDESWLVLSARYLDLARDAGALARHAVKDATGVCLAPSAALCHATMRGPRPRPSS